MKDKIFEFVKTRGPVLSKDVYKHFNISTTYAGAYLSELVQDKKLLYSKMKVGTTPVYYTPEQKEKLVMLFEHLNPKDKKSFEILKEKLVLQDTKLETIHRVSYRNLPDFAIPLTVNINGNKEIFWKWYMLNNEDASSKIKILLNGTQPVKKTEQITEPVKEATKEEPVSENPEKAKLFEIKKLLDKKKEELENEKIKLSQTLIEEREKLQKKFDEDMNQIREENKLLIETQKKRIEDLESRQPDESKVKALKAEIENLKNTASTEDLQKEFDKKLLEQKEKFEEQLSKQTDESEKDIEIENLRQKLQEVMGEEINVEEKSIDDEDDSFVKLISAWFKDKNIKVKNYNIIKKESEAEFYLTIPSVIGMTEHYCRAKDKKKCNEGDLSTAFVIGTIKKLPVLFLSTGEITKKAEKMLNTEFKNTLFFHRVENGS